MIAAHESAALAPVTLDEARAWLRLGSGQDDAIVAGLIRAATNVCELSIGQLLIVRTVTEELPIASGWMRLAREPVISVDLMTGLIADAPDFDIVVDRQTTSIGRDGAGAVKVDAPGAAGRVRVQYQAGMAHDANGVPEAIRQGILRLVQHLHGVADGDSGAPPAIVGALWSPWRRVGLGR